MPKLVGSVTKEQMKEISAGNKRAAAVESHQGPPKPMYSRLRDSVPTGREKSASFSAKRQVNEVFKDPSKIKGAGYSPTPEERDALRARIATYGSNDTVARKFLKTDTGALWHATQLNEVARREADRSAVQQLTHLGAQADPRGLVSLAHANRSQTDQAFKNEFLKERITEEMRKDTEPSVRVAKRTGKGGEMVTRVVAEEMRAEIHESAFNQRVAFMQEASAGMSYSVPANIGRNMKTLAATAGLVGQGAAAASGAAGASVAVGGAAAATEVVANVVGSRAFHTAEKRSRTVAADLQAPEITRQLAAVDGEYFHVKEHSSGKAALGAVVGGLFTMGGGNVAALEGLAPKAAIGAVHAKGLKDGGEILGAGALGTVNAELQSRTTAAAVDQALPASKGSKSKEDAQHDRAMAYGDAFEHKKAAVIANIRKSAFKANIQRRIEAKAQARSAPVAEPRPSAHVAPVKKQLAPLGRPPRRGTPSEK